MIKTTNLVLTCLIIILLTASCEKNYKALYFKAAAHGNTTELLEYINTKRIDINVIDNSARTALMIACENEKPWAVQALINAGADLNLQDKKNRTALMYAIKKENAEITAFLIAGGADVNITNIFGATALSMAEDGKNTAIIEMLKKAENKNPTDAN